MILFPDNPTVQLKHWLGTLHLLILASLYGFPYPHKYTFQIQRWDKADILFPPRFCSNIRPRCYIKSPTVWGSRWYSKHNRVGWGRFLFQFSFRLDSLIPLWLWAQNLPSVIKRALTVSPLAKELFLTRSNPMQKSPNTCLRVIMICNNLSCSWAVLVKMQNLCKMRDWRIHQCMLCMD